MTPLRIAFSVGLIIFATSINAYALIASGSSGSIDFDGKGTITHMQSPFLVNEVFGNSNCVAGIDGLVMTVCHPTLRCEEVTSSEQSLYESEGARSPTLISDVQAADPFTLAFLI